MMTCVLLFTLPHYNYNCESFCFYNIHYLCLCWSYLYRNFCCVTFTIIHRNNGLASVVSVYTHGYVTAVWGLLGAEKENESCIFFFIKSVRANGDSIDRVLGNFWWRTKLFLVLSMGCEMRQLWILLILGESISHLGFFFFFFLIFFYNFLE